LWWDSDVAVDGRDFVRPAEWRQVRRFIVAARTAPAGLVIQGEAGAGKSTLWRAGVRAAGEAGQRVLRSEPSAGEATMSFAGLSDLLADALPGIAGQIPGPQREALEVALLLRPAGDQPTRPGSSRSRRPPSPGNQTPGRVPGAGSARPSCSTWPATSNGPCGTSRRSTWAGCPRRTWSGRCRCCWT
jgi:hypothetical protein